jgi:hypothetical protein
MKPDYAKVMNSGEMKFMNLTHHDRDVNYLIAKYMILIKEHKKFKQNKKALIDEFNDLIEYTLNTMFMEYEWYVNVNPNDSPPTPFNKVIFRILDMEW